ncbi:Rho guanine nucleotide exchange factor 33 [Nibea albiflora]|uniref:Rho guanine nucleotide exchange factor 33 n=1 Tax=Nibea albiflora TaxID=240163 RepID=A0ACB7EEL8_NIBAL|nr:Rho guanine nucleotide exchange factor 33 [Nibea albiflora]
MLLVTQLQGLVAELREGLHAALTELYELRQRDHGLEEKLQAHQTDVDDKIMGLKNSLNTFKEELNVALFHIKDVSSRQREMQKRIELLQSENGKDVISVPHRKGSTADVLMASGDEHICAPSQSDLSVIQHFFSSLPHSGSPQRSNTTSTSASEQDVQQQQRGCQSKSPAWGERKNSRDDTETPNSPTENNKRQRVALELLESERVYVSHLSLLLKANISFNGSEALTSKDKRPFPSSLRFLIQQHLELLHTLQERVLKCQWQGIMGDVFMRLTSKESDFLDFYVSYLKELPDCLSVVTMLASSSLKSSSFLEQFRSFTAQYHHLLQHNQELLQHNHKEMKRSTMKQLLKTVESGIQANNIGSPYPCNSAMLEHANQVKRSKQRLLEQIQSHHFQDWDRDQDSENHYDTEWPSQLPFYSPDLNSRNQKPTDPPGMESLYEEDGGSFHDVSMFDRCSSASSDSSIDIAFVKCPKAPLVSHHAMAANVSNTRDVFGNGGSQGTGYSKLPNRGCVSPDEAVMMRRNQHRPLQASQRKSKSLNGLQMECNTVSLDGGHLSDHLHKVGLGSHAKLERQGSKGSKGCPTPSRKVHSPLGNRVDTDKQSDDLHGLLSIDSGFQSWGDESKWRGGTEENNHTPFSERSRKQDKGGFRSSFKKLFKKKSGDEKKEKGGEKTPENQNNVEHETAGKTPKLVHLEINRGTAV